MDIKELVKKFDGSTTQPQNLFGIKLCRPTKESIHIINQKLGIKTPKSVIEFLSLSNRQDLIASFGEDYNSPWHVIKINKMCQQYRRRVIGGKGRWEYVFPKNLVAFNLGHDDDWMCFNLDKQNEKNGEYQIDYWAPPRLNNQNLYSTFYQYIKAHSQHY